MTTVLAIILIPILGAFVLPLFGLVNEKLRNVLAVIFAAATFCLSLKLIPQAFSSKSVGYLVHACPLGMNISFVADPLAIFMAIVSSFLSLIIVFYSIDYISHYKNRNEYYLLVLLFLGAMMGIVFSSNLILLYIFWEITGIVSWRLIGFFRNKADVLKADKAFLVTAFGALAMLIGFVSLYQVAGSFELSAIAHALKTHPVSNLAVLLILFGIFSKSATLPFHTWLPDAGVAPSPVTALLHAAVLVKIGVYVFARLFIGVIPLSATWHLVIPAIAAISAIVAAGAALIDTDIKRIIAYSTVSQIAFIFLGLSTGNIIGITGALLYILFHGIAKAGLFLCAGIIEQNTHTKDITKLGGLITSMPLTAFSFLICAFSVMGVPPMGGFFSKYLVFQGAIQAKEYWITGVFLLGAFLTIIYLFRVFMMVFLGEVKVFGKERSALMVYSVLFLAILSFLGGIFINYPANFAEVAARQALGANK